MPVAGGVLRWIPSYVWKTLINIETVYVHAFSIVLEAIFLRRNFIQLLADRNWYYLSSSSNNLPTRLVVLLPLDTLPIQKGNQWEVRFNSNQLQCSFLWARSPGVSLERAWQLFSPENVSPSKAVKIVTICFVCVRWIMLIARCIIIITRKHFSETWDDVLIFSFAYICACVLSISIIGSEIRDCVEWWGLGGDGLRLFMWQPAMWIINTVLLGLFAGCTLGVNRRPFQFNLHNLAFIDCNDPPKVLGCIFFGASSFLSSILVMTLGIFKPWIVSIWFGLFLLVLDFNIRQSFDKYALHDRRDGLFVEYIGTSGSSRALSQRFTKLPSLLNDTSNATTDGMIFRRVPHTHLFDRVSTWDNVGRGHRNPPGMHGSVGMPSEGLHDSEQGMLCPHIDDYNVTAPCDDRCIDNRNVSNSTTPINSPTPHPKRTATPLSITPDVLGRPSSTSGPPQSPRQEAWNRSTSNSGKLPSTRSNYVFDEVLASFVEDGISGICLVCIEQPSVIIIQPCRHGVVCRLCMEKLVARENEKLRRYAAIGQSTESSLLCPLCRTKAEELYEVDGEPQTASNGDGIYWAKRVWTTNPAEKTGPEQTVNREAAEPAPQANPIAAARHESAASMPDSASGPPITVGTILIIEQ